MKTTYQSKNTTQVVKEEEVVSQEVVSENNATLVDAFLDLKQASDKVNSKAVKSASVGADEALVKSYDKALKKEVEVKKGGSKVPLILCIVMLICIVVTVGLFFLNKISKEKLLSQYNDILVSVESSYIQLELGSTVDTKSYRDALIPLENKGVDVSEANSKLDCIDTYINDKAKLNSLNNCDVDMLSDEYRSVLDEVESNSDLNYSVPQLRVLIKSLIKEAEGDVEDFKDLKETMLSDNDFSSTKYQDKVVSVVQDIQRNELEAIIGVKNAELSYKNALDTKEELSKPVENEGVANSKLTKEQREKRDEDIAAKEQALIDIETTIVESELGVFEAYCTLYGIQDKVYGTSTLSKYMEEWEKTHNTDEDVELTE